MNYIHIRSVSEIWIMLAMPLPLSHSHTDSYDMAANSPGESRFFVLYMIHKNDILMSSAGPEGAGHDTEIQRTTKRILVSCSAPLDLHQP